MVCNSLRKDNIVGLSSYLDYLHLLSISYVANVYLFLSYVCSDYFFINNFSVRRPKHSCRICYSNLVVNLPCNAAVYFYCWLCFVIQNMRM